VLDELLVCNVVLDATCKSIILSHAEDQRRIALLEALVARADGGGDPVATMEELEIRLFKREMERSRIPSTSLEPLKGPRSSDK
jgi:hypothetical protein